MKKLLLLFSLIGLAGSLFSQITAPNLLKVNDGITWEIFNRHVEINHDSNQISLIFDARQGDGLAVFHDLDFENGSIEFDVKGKDVLQQSFVGVAFHIQNNSTFNAIYFRPFNFQKPERSSHSVQYISHPQYTWQKLRIEFPEQYEKKVHPVPNPDEFFHAKIEVKWPIVKVFVENSENPSLVVDMKSNFKKGKVGFWVGNGSDGAFRNLTVKRD